MKISSFAVVCCALFTVVSVVRSVESLPILQNGKPWVFEPKGFSVVKLRSEDDYRKINEHDLEVDRIDPADSSKLYAYLSGAEAKLLDKLGLEYSFIDDPAQKGHESRIEASEKNSQGTKYHNYSDLTQFVQNISRTYPSICKEFTIGKSVENRELWGVRISGNVGVNEPEPEFLYVGNMHGDETVGRQMLIYLIDHLCSNYHRDDNVKLLVDSTDIYIIPSMNPDGFEYGRRPNARGYDLNRNFPDQYRSSSFVRQPEVSAIMDWSATKRFVLSANMHGGALVANYPFDGTAAGTSTYNPTADNDLFKEMSLVYSKSHASMHRSRYFTDGVVNGAQWYALYGGMQDWNYLTLGNFQITLELSDIKYPPASQLTNFWNDNRSALLAFMKFVHRGAKGFVKDADGNPISARVYVVGRSQAVFTDPEFGDYYRMLMPGTYVLRAEADGFVPQQQNVTIVQTSTTTCNFVLQRTN